MRAPISSRLLEDRTAVVVGGVRGIGGAISATLAREGARVAAVFHRGAEAAPGLEAHVAAAGGTLLAVSADVRQEAAFRARLRELEGRLGAVDVLVYAAGVSRGMPLIGADVATMREVFEVNYWGAVVACQEYLPGMLARHLGRVILVSSVMGDRGGLQGQVAYASSKAGLNALARTLAAEISSRGNLTVNAVAPGPVRTDLTDRGDDAGDHSRRALRYVGRGGRSRGIPRFGPSVVRDRPGAVRRWRLRKQVRQRAAVEEGEAVSASPPSTVEERVRAILCELLVLRAEEVTSESLLMDELDADSITFLETFITLEKEFGLDLPDVKADEATLSLPVPDALRKLEDMAGGTTFLEYLKEDAVRSVLGASASRSVRNELFQQLSVGSFAKALNGRVPSGIDPDAPLASLRLTMLFRFLTVGTLARYVEFIVAGRYAHR
ncbi:MAG: SDR family NAD(P)-dependent oxidoreductase [Chloroflexi bacterium]|nr:MAG: SDR family NAD(P)-dependent oxidoreductase [Chloroflexota bacterium]